MLPLERECVTLECEVCGKVSTIQLFYRNNEELAYRTASTITVWKVVSPNLNSINKP